MDLCYFVEIDNRIDTLFFASAQGNASGRLVSGEHSCHVTTLEHTYIGKVDRFNITFSHPISILSLSS